MTPVPTRPSLGYRRSTLGREPGPVLPGIAAVDDKVSVVGADIRDHEDLLTDPVLTTRIDGAAPVCVLQVSLLHFLAPAEADAAVTTFREWMPPGSYLVISAGTSTGTDPELIRRLQDAYGDTAPVTGRTAWA